MSVVQVHQAGISKTFHCFLDRIPEFLKYSQFFAHLKMELEPQVLIKSYSLGIRITEQLHFNST